MSHIPIPHLEILLTVNNGLWVRVNPCSYRPLLMSVRAERPETDAKSNVTRYVTLVTLHAKLLHMCKNMLLEEQNKNNDGCRMLLKSAVF